MLEPLHASISQSLQEHRSLSILSFYLTSSAALTIKILLNIYRRYQIRKTQLYWRRSYGPQFAIFITLSILSIATTWYYMFAFFAHSYRSWEAGLSPTQQALNEMAPLLVKWEMWLRDTKLFREAWESVFATPARTWWSGQIFLWTIGWSFFLGVMGRRYNIPSVWMYMLLGQIVAISFAQNLFFVTVLASSPSMTSAAKLAWMPPALFELAPVVISGLGAAALPFVANTPYFLPILAITHLLLFVPGILSPRVLPRGWGGYIAHPTRRYAFLYKWLLAIGIAIQAQSTYLVVLDESPVLGASVVNTGRRLIDSMLEHPAVSSVGWDVVCCTISGIFWAWLRGGFEEIFE